MIEAASIIFAIIALVNYLLFGSHLVNACDFYIGLSMLIITINRKKEIK